MANQYVIGDDFDTIYSSKRMVLAEVKALLVGGLTEVELSTMKSNGDVIAQQYRLVGGKMTEVR